MDTTNRSPALRSHRINPVQSHYPIFQLSVFPYFRSLWPMKDSATSVQQKAIRINLDSPIYGTFAEIGAGQEVARWFFQVGGASGTVAKTMSAYDMAVSDAIYGSGDRYVSRQRLRAMLDHEFNLLLERLDMTQGDKRTFFVFADTVATHSFTRKEEGHGWMGIRFQTEPHSAPSEILIHVRLIEKENVRQQESLGLIGVNLIHAAFYHRTDPAALIGSLLDNLTWERVEVDMIRCSGPAFAGVDNRLLALLLVQQGLTEAAMFNAAGEVVQWAEVLYKKPVLVQRGSFHPVTNATLDVLERSHDKFAAELRGQNEEPVTLMEMTLRHLTTGDAIDHQDFLNRADMLGALGKSVLISNFRRFHRLANYLSRYTSRPLGIALGASKLKELFDESFYNAEEGGMLGGLGQLFKNQSRVYVYPSLSFKTGEIVTVENYPIAPAHRLLYEYFRQSGSIQALQPSQPDLMNIRSHDVLKMIQSRDASWEKFVPSSLVHIIRERHLFGCKQ